MFNPVQFVIDKYTPLIKGTKTNSINDPRLGNRNQTKIRLFCALSESENQCLIRKLPTIPLFFSKSKIKALLPKLNRFAINFAKEKKGRITIAIRERKVYNNVKPSFLNTIFVPDSNKRTKCFLVSFKFIIDCDVSVVNESTIIGFENSSFKK